LNTLTLQLPSNVEKEAEAKRGITKLLLFHICGKLSDDSTSFGNLSYPKPAQGMRIILDSAQPACTTGFSNLIRNTYATAKDLDLMNIRSCLISIMFIIYSFLKHIFNLFAKFAMDFGSVNVMTGLCPLAELNTKPLVKALTVLKAFEDQLTLTQSTNSPIPILAATISKFSTRSLGTNSNVGILAPAPIYASALPENTH
jgi:hypothetical protein